MCRYDGASPKEIIHRKKYIVIFPDGHEEKILNMRKFCRDYEKKSGMWLHPKVLSSVARGRQKQ